MPRLKNGMARVEFLAVRAEAEALLAKGHPASSIYEHFKSNGKISMSYRAFHRHLKGTPRKKDERKEAPATPSVTVPARETTPPEAVPSPISHAPRRIGAVATPNAWRNAVPSAESLTIKPVQES